MKKTMKSMFRALPMSLAALVLCSTALLGPQARAYGQDAPPPPPSGQGPGQGRGMMMGPKAQLDAMATQVGLTDEQKPKILEILQDRQKQMAALRADTSVSQEDRRPKMMAIMQGSNEKIKALLTEDQKVKFDAMMAQMRRGRGEQGPPPPPQ